ncbi:MAG: hypothetical protein HXX80_07320 [Nitrososphaerales archaeon]|nr:hypothetical protein [Nitrososphaerales archaeon]
MRKNILILILFLNPILLTIPLHLSAENLKISASGSWLLSIDQSNLISGGRSNLQSTYQSPPDATLIDIKANKKSSWAVYVRRIPLPNNLTIDVRRTSDGRGQGTIEGGENFIPLGEGYTMLFRGRGERKDITVQYRIRGVSISISPGLRDLQIIYTVEEDGK